MTTLLFVRHAEHVRQGHTLVGRMEGIGLGETGRWQTQRLAERLSRHEVDAVLSSPIQRARETAEPIADRLGTDIELAEELTEVDYGDWTGREMDELSNDTRWHWWNMHRSSSRPPGGENPVEIQGRVLRLVERLHRDRPGARFVLVSHGDTIRAALAHFLGIPLDLSLRLEVSPASISEVEFEDWGPRVLRVNEVP